MIVFFDRNFVDIFFSWEKFFSFFCCTKFPPHLFFIHAFFETEVYIRFLVFIGIQKIVALILRIWHAEFFIDIFGQRMYLQGKVLTAHRIQQVKTDLEFCAEPAVDSFTQQFMRRIEDKILCRYF